MNENNNFMKLFKTVNKIREEKYEDFITEELLFDLLKIENDNFEIDTDMSSKEIIQLLDKYFEKKALL